MTISPGPLRAVAIGDTYGAQYEYRKGRKWLAENTGAIYTRHPTHTDLEPGKYTDDTQLSIAVAELMLAMRGEGLPSSGSVDAYLLNAYFRDKRVGYSKGMLAAMQKAQQSQASLSLVCATFGKTEKSGAAMRATPLGLYADAKYIRKFARFQGQSTHSGGGLVAAEGAALAAHYMLYRLGPRSGMPAYVARQTNNREWLTPWQGPVGSPGMESARAALTAVADADSLRDVLIRSCAFTGDVDTVAAIAMGCAWAYPDLPNDLPDSLWEGLENGPYGRDYLREMDERLMQKFAPALAA